MTNNAVFWNKAARGYAKRPVADEAAYAHTLDRTRSYLKATDKVLEAGCGTGTTALKLADAAAEIVATDVASEMIAIAREKGKDTGNVRFEVADETLNQFGNDSFDAVLAFNLIHLVPNPQSALRRFHDVLKPGGFFVSKTPCLGGNLMLRPMIRVMQFFGKAPFVSFLRPDDVANMVERAGLEIVERANHNKRTWGHFIVARKPL